MEIKIKDNMSQKILVTGGLGYVGGRVSRFLSGKKDVEIIITTRKKRAVFPKWIKKRNILEVDMSLNSDLYKACEGIDCIVHFAGMNEIECARNPEKALEVNAGNTYRLLQAAVQQKVKKIIYFSTAHVYGYPLAGEISENSATQPAYNYAITHKLAEDYVLKESLNGSIKGTIFRLTNGVGSPINKEANCWMLVVNDLCKQVVLNHKMKLHSHKLTQRDFVAITEVCSIVSHALVDDMLNNEIINISSGVSLTLEELTSIIADESSKLFDFRPEVDFRQSLNFEHIEKLSISSKKLKNFGYCINSDLSNEIRNLLINCQNWFL